MKNNQSLSNQMQSVEGRHNLFMEMIRQDKVKQLQNNEFELSDVHYKERTIINGKAYENLALEFPDKKSAIGLRNMVNNVTKQPGGCEYEFTHGKHIVFFYFLNLKNLKKEHKVIENTTSSFKHKCVMQITKQIKIVMFEALSKVMKLTDEGASECPIKFMYASVIIDKSVPYSKSHIFI